MSSRTLPRLAAVVVAAAVPALAAAHPGSLAAHLGAPHGFADGFAHPFTGLDHLGALLGTGLWAARDTRRSALAPLGFIACLLAGALATAGGRAWPGTEAAIALSLMALGALLARGPRVAGPASAALVAGFAFFHGAAHGAELGAGPALAGMVVASAVLLAVGVALGRALRAGDAAWTRRAGWLLAAGGAALMVAG